MSWLLPTMLGALTLIVSIFLWSLERMMAQLLVYTRIYGEENINKLNELYERIDRIEGHTSRSAQPFYDADADRILHPERYDSNL